MQNISGKPGNVPIAAAEWRQCATRGQRALKLSSSGRARIAAKIACSLPRAGARGARRVVGGKTGGERRRLEIRVVLGELDDRSLDIEGGDAALQQLEP